MDMPKGQHTGTWFTSRRFKLGSLKRALSRLNDRSCRQNPLLGLPVEVLAQILRLLSPDTLLVTSETCVLLRRLSHTIRDGRGLTRGEHLRYLTTLVRDKPGVWVCGECMKARKLSIADTPSNPTLPPGCVTRGSGHRDQQVVCRHIPLDRHVQAALKYSRLYSGHGLQQRGRLAREVLLFRFGRIMAPSRNIYQTNPLHREHTADHAVLPKIVQGHFLLRSTWHFPTNSDYEEPYLRAMGFLRICRHQGFLYTGDKTIKDHAESLEAARRRMNPEEQSSSRVVSAQRWLRAQPSVASLNKLPAALEEARAFGKKVQRFCNACPSDFTVEVGRASTTIRLWQDLGCEGPPSTCHGYLRS